MPKKRPFTNVYARIFIIYRITNFYDHKIYIGQSSNGSARIREHQSGLINDPKSTNLDLAVDYQKIADFNMDPTKYIDFEILESKSVVGKYCPREIHLIKIEFQIKEILAIQQAREERIRLYNKDTDQFYKLRLAEFRNQKSSLQKQIDQNPVFEMHDEEPSIEDDLFSSFESESSKSSDFDQEVNPFPKIKTEITRMLPSNVRACWIDGITYTSVLDASRQLSRNPGVLRDHLKPENTNYMESYYLDIPEEKWKITPSFTPPKSRNAPWAVEIDGERFPSVRQAKEALRKKDIRMSTETIIKLCEDQITEQWKNWKIDI